MTPESFQSWLISKGYSLGAFSSGHLGRQDAWTKTFDPKALCSRTVRYFMQGTQVRKESSIGFSSFVVEWTAPYASLSLTPEGKLIRAK